MKKIKMILSLAILALSFATMMPANAEDAAPALPTATVTEIPTAEIDANVPLTYSLQFKADAVTDEQLEYYGSWYADYVITANKDIVLGDGCDAPVDGYLAGQYDGKWESWDATWLKVPYGTYAPVTLNANEGLKIMSFAAELMGEPGLKYTYAEVYNVVKKFNCGLYLNDEFLAANQDLVVTLELRMYNNKNESESYTIGETYTFTVPKKLENNGVYINSLPVSDIGGYQMAIISGLDSLSFDAVGFEYQVGDDPRVFTYEDNTVFTAINTTDSEGNPVRIDGSFLKDNRSKYVYGILLKLQSQTNYTVTWRPYAVKDGKKIYGKYRETPFIEPIQ